MNKRLAILSSSMAVVLLTPFMVFAQEFGNLIELAENFKQLLDVLTVVIIALALVFFLWGLAVFILSAGDEEKRGKGKQIMIWGAIAFTVMLGIWGIVTFLLDAFGIGGVDTPEIPTVPDLP